MRGNPIRPRQGEAVAGSIPAHAGEPSKELHHGDSNKVYPRACGGTVTVHVAVSASAGLSPRMRGNHHLRGRGRVGRRSIPAHAGEPSALCGRPLGEGVYPRACGGTPRACCRNGCRRRSIPAHAGEPLSGSRSCGTHTVYPRACGGTGADGFSVSISWGLSPRMRGNQFERLDAAPVKGSIPAHAGEPSARPSPTWSIRVYPRACGGTVRASRLPGTIGGLSPRMRGNLAHYVVDSLLYGSIPAHAGEPPQSRPCGQSAGVYPRACGGTGFE